MGVLLILKSDGNIKPVMGKPDNSNQKHDTIIIVLIYEHELYLIVPVNELAVVMDIL